jgi:hypothetical protein
MLGLLGLLRLVPRDRKVSAPPDEKATATTAIIDDVNEPLTEEPDVTD